MFAALLVLMIVGSVWGHIKDKKTLTSMQDRPHSIARPEEIVIRSTIKGSRRVESIAKSQNYNIVQSNVPRDAISAIKVIIMLWL